MNRIFLGLIFVLLCACSGTEVEKQLEVVREEPINTIQTTGFIKIDDSYLIDTLAILTNKNLDPLLKSVEQAELTTFNNVKDIPYFIKSFLDSQTGGDFSIINYGEDWQSTDVIFEEGLAERELVYLGSGNDITLMAYHTGGIGKSLHILIFRHKDNKLSDFWAGKLLKTFRTKDEIVRYLNENKDKKWGLNTNIIYL